MEASQSSPARRRGLVVGLATILTCVPAWVSMMVSLRYPPRFVRGIIDGELMRGVLAAFLLIPVCTIAFLAARYLAAPIHRAAVVVAMIFGALYVHEGLFGLKMPDHQYSHDLLQRAFLVGIFLLVILGIPYLIGGWISRVWDSLRSPRPCRIPHEEQAGSSNGG